MHPDLVDKLRNLAFDYGATDFGISKAKNKRFYVIYNDHIINFGSKDGLAYIDHEDDKKLHAWRARHSKIYNKNGLAYKDKSSPEFWSWHLTWS
jgi:hypothetical protein